MASPLRALIAESNQEDARLVVGELRRSGYELTFRVIDTAKDFRTALRNEPWDVIISDFNMANFTGLEALEILANEAADIPFVLFSGTIVEDMAISAMRMGARDCILKDNLRRLVPAIEREVEHARNRRDHRQTERDITVYRRQLADLVRNIPVGVYRRTPGPNGKFVMANPMIAKIFGYKTVDEFRQCDFADLFVKKADREQSFEKIARDGHVEGELLRLKKKDGTRIWGLVTAHVVLNDDGEIEYIDGIIEDYTQRKVSEEAMIQSEKMLSVGGLAAGMAHEINNPLAGIMQNAGLLQIRLTRDIPANHKAAEEAGTTLESIRAYTEKRDLTGLLTRMQDATGRAAEIVRNMLQFARKSTAQVTPHNIGTLLDRAIALAESVYDLKREYDFRQIEVVCEYEPDLPAVYCEESKIQQVFLNILSNGAKVMSGNRGPAKPKFVIRTFKDDDRVRVEIEDNGPGMDEETRKRVFEPFFTTKPAGVGTGLGLSVSYFIITENHNGEMWVESAPGRGSTFFIRLPAGGGQ